MANTDPLARMRLPSCRKSRTPAADRNVTPAASTTRRWGVDGSMISANAARSAPIVAMSISPTIRTRHSAVSDVATSTCIPGVIIFPNRRAAAARTELPGGYPPNPQCGVDDRRGLTVGVRNGSVWAGMRPEANPDAGRFGLRVVASLSDRWGVLRHDDGKTVWALLRSGPAGEPAR